MLFTNEMGCLRLTYYPSADLRIIKGTNVLTSKKSVLILRNCKEARLYDCDVARFLSTDPWQTKYPEWSTYNYVMGNPLLLIDPSGKGPEDPSDNNGIDQNDGFKRIRTINFGLFTLTFRKGTRRLLGIPSFSLGFDWNYTIQKETSQKPVTRNQKFVTNNLHTVQKISGSPLRINYPNTAIGDAEREGKTLREVVNGMSSTDYLLTKVTVSTQMNDHPGDTFYHVEIGDQKAEHNNSHNETDFDPTRVTMETEADVSLYNQTPASDGMYDHCNGYKLTVKIQFNVEKTVTKRRIVRKAPK